MTLTCFLWKTKKKQTLQLSIEPNQTFCPYVDISPLDDKGLLPRSELCQVKIKHFCLQINDKSILFKLK